jgi:choline kinase
MGRRMKSYGPKPLFGIGNHTLLELQLDVLLNVFPNADVNIIIGFEANKVRNYVRRQYNARLIYNPLWEETNVTLSASLGLFSCNLEHVLLIHGDLLFNEDAIYGITQNTSKVLVDTTNQLKEEEVGLVCDPNTDIVTNFSYGLPTKWGQIVYLTDREFKLFERIAHNHDLSKKWFIYEALNKVIEQKGRFHTHRPSGLKLIDIDTKKDLTEAQ